MKENNKTTPPIDFFLKDMRVWEGLKWRKPRINLLATLVHLSDLHFSEIFTNDEHKYKEHLASLPFVKGTCTHSYVTARALANRVNQILKDRKKIGVPAGVVFTGDLTSSGKREEFVVGSTFLREAHSTGAGSSVGLRLGHPTSGIILAKNSADLSSVPTAIRTPIVFNRHIKSKLTIPITPTLFSVPGHHDIWQRKHPDMLSDYYRHFTGPFPQVWRIQTRSRLIYLYGLDSTQNTSFRHKLAMGRVQPEQLDDLFTLMESIKERETEDTINIVFLHHPLLDPTKHGWDIGMKLDDWKMIARRLMENGADLVLAGHVHEELHFSADLHRPHHAVAGTATQQFSECNFLLLDLFEDHILKQVFKFSKEDQKFVLDPTREHKFPLAKPTISRWIFRCEANK